LPQWRLQAHHLSPLSIGPRLTGDAPRCAQALLARNNLTTAHALSPQNLFADVRRRGLALARGTTHLRGAALVVIKRPHACLSYRAGTFDRSTGRSGRPRALLSSHAGCASNVAYKHPARYRRQAQQAIPVIYHSFACGGMKTSSERKRPSTVAKRIFKATKSGNGENRATYLTYVTLTWFY